MSTKIKKLMMNRVLIKDIEPEEKIGLIYIPESARKKEQKAIVIKTGTGKKDKNGNYIPIQVKEGDMIFYTEYLGHEIELDGEKYRVLFDDDINCVLEE